MLDNILNLKGVTILKKREQEIVKGGSQVCRLTRKRHDGSYSIVEFTYSNGSNASNEANKDCVSMLQPRFGYQSCHYDCEYDGFESLT